MLTFSVPGLPPKKDGANSMWRKHPEVDRLIALRLAAAGALGDRQPLDRGVKVTLVVHLVRNDRSMGDLDNMVTGVLDGLQRAHPNTPWDQEPKWHEPEHRHIQPDTWAAITDDVEVVEIVARKVVGDVEVGEERYEVEISQEHHS